MTDEERDTVVVHDDSSSNTGAILGIIAIIVLLAAVWYFALGPGSSGSGSTYTNDNGGVNPPAATQEIPNPVGS